MKFSFRNKKMEMKYNYAVILPVLSNQKEFYTQQSVYKRYRIFTQKIYINEPIYRE